MSLQRNVTSLVLWVQLESYAIQSNMVVEAKALYVGLEDVSMMVAVKRVGGRSSYISSAVGEENWCPVVHSL
ncbi:hypothetical protein LguiB_013412 [Lonicera macranthoides]